MTNFLKVLALALVVAGMVFTLQFDTRAAVLPDEDPIVLDVCDAALIIMSLDTMTMSFAGTGSPYPDAWRTSADRDVVETNADLIASAREAGLLIIYFYGNYQYLREGDELAAFADEIAPQDGDVVIERPFEGQDLYTDTVLLETLEAHDIQSLVFSGVNTGYWVNRPAQYGERMGFDVTIVADAHSGGLASYAQSYNDYWPTVGIAVVPFSEVDFVALCAVAEEEG